MSKRNRQKESRHKRQEKKRLKKQKNKTCTCSGGAFSDAMSDSDWKKVMRSRSNCPVHQSY